MNKELMFSSKTDLWATPDDLADSYVQKYNLKLDVCATDENAKCVNYFTIEQDALTQEWNLDFWMNPPYSRQMYKWIDYAYSQHIKHNVTGVLLLPSRTDTRWFHDFVLDNAYVKFLKGRLKFVGAPNNAPFPSLIAVFQKKK